MSTAISFTVARMTAFLAAFTREKHPNFCKENSRLVLSLHFQGCSQNGQQRCDRPITSKVSWLEVVVGRLRDANKNKQKHAFTQSRGRKKKKAHPLVEIGGVWGEEGDLFGWYVRRRERWPSPQALPLSIVLTSAKSRHMGTFFHKAKPNICNT